MHTRSMFTLTIREAALARAALGGIESRIFHAAAHDRLADLRWLTHPSGPITSDKRDRIIATLTAAVTVLNDQANPATWAHAMTGMPHDPSAVHPLASGLAAARQRTADRAAELLVLLSEPATPEPVVTTLADGPTPAST